MDVSLSPSAQNGFMNGILDEDGLAEVDVYPADGPLHSGTNSLRRVKSTTKVMISLSLSLSLSLSFSHPLIIVLEMNKLTNFLRVTTNVTISERYSVVNTNTLQIHTYCVIQLPRMYNHSFGRPNPATEICSTEINGNTSER